MFGAGTSVALVAGALAVITVAALRIPGMARVFLLAQVVYWSLSYVARPVVLLLVQPRPAFADNVADPRLAVLGYDHGISMVLQPVVFGLWIYAAAVASYALLQRDRPPADSGRCDEELLPTLAICYGLGLLGRLAAYAGGTAGSAGEVESGNPFLIFAADLASVGAVGLIILFTSANRRTVSTVLACLVAGELLWSVAVESKTPIMGAALAVMIRFARQGWNRTRALAVTGTAVLGVAGFGWLQSIKESPATEAAAELTSAGYPPLVQPLLGVLRRFDLLEAATDAYYLNGRGWLSLEQVLTAVLQNMVPAQLLGTEKFHSGLAWATQVRAASVDMSGITVSLADGNINEGFVLGGYPGVVAGVLFTFVLLLCTVRMLRSTHIAPFVLGVALTESPVLFERGILGGTEVLGKSLQLVVLVWMIDLAVRALRSQAESRGGPTPGFHHIDAPAGVGAKGI